MNSREFFLLYTDENGDEVGLDEVQLIEPPISERIPELVGLLDSNELFISYQAALVLAAWGNKCGLNKIEEFIDMEKSKDYCFEPNRISGDDNFYDDLSYAVYLYGLSGGDREEIVNIIRKILKIYHKYYFDSKLKYVLQKSNFSELTDDIDNAIHCSIISGKYIQASDLFIAFAQLDSHKCLAYIKKIQDHLLSNQYASKNMERALEIIYAS